MRSNSSHASDTKTTDVRSSFQTDEQFKPRLAVVSPEPPESTTMQMD